MKHDHDTKYDNLIVANYSATLFTYLFFCNQQKEDVENDSLTDRKPD